MMYRRWHDAFSRTSLAQLIDEWVHDEIDRTILKRRLLDNAPFQGIADEVFLSEDRTKKRFYESEHRLAGIAETRT